MSALWALIVNVICQRSCVIALAVLKKKRRGKKGVTEPDLLLRGVGHKSLKKALFD